METKLVDLVGEWKQVAEMSLDPEVDQQVIADTLEAIEGEIEVKAVGYAKVIRKIEFEKAAISARKAYVKDILKELTAMEDNCDNRVNWLKENLKAGMIAVGKEKFKTDTLSFNVRGAGGKQKLEKVEEKVPDNFKRVVYEDDDDKIREYLKDHKCDWAKLLPRTTYLEIKGV